jgi:hypothetical protein
MKFSINIVLFALLGTSLAAPVSHDDTSNTGTWYDKRTPVDDNTNRDAWYDESKRCPGEDNNNINSWCD